MNNLEKEKEIMMGFLELLPESEQFELVKKLGDLFTSKYLLNAFIKRGEDTRTARNNLRCSKLNAIELITKL